jgi:hypothetical protein
VLKQAAFTEAGATVITTELVTVPDVIPAFAALYGSVDELKHHTSGYREQTFKKAKKRFGPATIAA